MRLASSAGRSTATSRSTISTTRESYFAYLIRLEGRLPAIEVPLFPGDSPVPLDLQAVFGRSYDAGPYFLEIAYGTDPLVPPLRADQDGWAAHLLRDRPGF